MIMSNASPSIHGENFHRRLHTGRLSSNTSHLPSQGLGFPNSGTNHQLLHSTSNRSGLNAAMHALNNPILTMTNGLEIIKEEKKNSKKNKVVIDANHKRTCRICLCEESAAKNDPIVSPCMCKGYSGDIHIKCLQEWLNQERKVNKLYDFQENYIYKKSQCEVCGSLYPDQMDIDGTLYPIFDFNKPK